MIVSLLMIMMFLMMKILHMKKMMIVLCPTLVFLRRPVIVSQPEHLVYDGDDCGNDDDADEIVMTIMLCLTLGFLHRPVIVSQPEHLVVDNGMTISLPCIVDQIPGDDWFRFLSPFF